MDELDKGKLLIDASKDAKIRSQEESNKRQSIIMLIPLVGFIILIILLGLFGNLKLILSLSFTLTFSLVLFGFLYLIVSTNYLKIYETGLIFTTKHFGQDIYIQYSNIKSITKLSNGYYNIILLNKIRGISKSVFLSPDLIPNIIEFEKTVSNYILIEEFDTK